MPDYEDLAFKPAMTYRDVRKYAKELAKKKGLLFYFLSRCFRLGNLWVYAAGKVYTGSDNYGIKVKSFERVKNIIDNLYD